MAIAPVIGLAVTAAGTAATISAQSSAAKKQGQAIADQRLIAQDSLTLKTKALEQAKLSNERRFEKERSVLDAQTRQARINLDIQREQANLQDLQTTAQIEAVGAQSEIQAQQLAAAASAVETEAATANTEQLFQLAERFLGSEEAANNFITQFAVATGSSQLSETAEALLTGQQLEDVAAGQATRRDVTTRDRIAGAESSIQRRQADLVREQGVLSTDYLSTVQDLQRRANDISFKQAAADIESTSQQNLKALEAASLASQAQLRASRGAASLEFRSQSAALDAQQASIQQPNIIGAVSGLGVQAFGAFSQPSLLGSSSSSLFGSTAGPSFQSTQPVRTSGSNLSFGTQFRTGL